MPGRNVPLRSPSRRMRRSERISAAALAAERREEAHEAALEQVLVAREQGELAIALHVVERAFDQRLDRPQRRDAFGHLQVVPAQLGIGILEDTQVERALVAVVLVEHAYAALRAGRDALDAHAVEAVARELVGRDA